MEYFAITVVTFIIGMTIFILIESSGSAYNKRKQKKSVSKNASDMKVFDEYGNEEDPFLSKMINEAYRTGKPVVGNRHDDGTEEMHVIETDHD